jgi:hypothetical protein
VDTIQLLGSMMGLGFVAGVRLYSTVLVLGLGLQFGWLHAPAGFEQHFGLLTNPIVLGAAALAYLAEFFADKIPWVDSLWDGFHTFVRPLGAVLLGVTMLGPIDPALKLAMVILCGGVAFTSHSSKAATRLAANHSPEPFSNIGLSLIEDALAPLGVWLSLNHPGVVLGVVAAFLAVFLWLSPKVFRLIRVQIVALWAWLTSWDREPEPAGDAISAVARLAAPLPEGHTKAALKHLTGGRAAGVRCAATKKIRGLRNSVGYLVVSDQLLLFVTRRLFVYRVHKTNREDVESAEIQRGLLMNRLVLRTAEGEVAFHLFKGARGCRTFPQGLSD